MNPTETAIMLMRERGITKCQVKGCGRDGEEAHHCLYGAKRGKHPVPELDMPENLQLVCRIDHHITGRAKSWENKLDYWKWACDFYGHDHMVRWHENLPLKIKEKAYR